MGNFQTHTHTDRIPRGTPRYQPLSLSNPAIPILRLFKNKNVSTCSLQRGNLGIRGSEIWSRHRPRLAVWPGPAGQGPAARGQGGVPAWLTAPWPSRRLPSQETAFRADTTPLWGEALQLALIYDLTSCLRSLRPPDPGQPPSYRRGHQGLGRYLAQVGRPQTSADRCHPERVLRNSPGRSTPRRSFPNELQTKLPNVADTDLLVRQEQPWTRWPAHRQSGWSEPGPGPCQGNWTVTHSAHSVDAELRTYMKFS